MRTPLVLTFVGSCLALHVFAGCSDDETGAAPTSSSSSGGSSGASSSGGSSGASSSGGSSGASSSGSSGDDGGGDGGIPVKSCATPVRVDTLRGVNGSDRISAASYGNKWAVTWFQIGSVSPDALYHAKARFFDGNTLLTEQDLGTYDYSVTAGLVSDGNGHGFFSRVMSNTDSERYVLDYATGAFGAGTAFDGTNFSDGAQQMAAIPGGGAISLYRSAAGVMADRWLPGDPTWKTTALAGAPANSYGQRLRVNATGKAAAAWYSSDGSGTTISVATFNGTSWAPTATKLLAAAGGPLGVLEIGIYSNGDVLVVYEQGADQIFHHVRLTASTGVFGTVGDIGTATNAATYPPGVIIDPMDRVTVTYLDGAKAMARRDLGAGFLPVQDLGAATGQRIDLDPTTNNVFIVTYQLPTLSIRGVTPTSNTWTAAIPLNLGVSNQEDPKRQAATVFDSAGKPTVLSQMDAPGTGGLELFYVKCQ